MRFEITRNIRIKLSSSYLYLFDNTSAYSCSPMYNPKKQNKLQLKCYIHLTAAHHIWKMFLYIADIFHFFNEIELL